MVEFQLSGPGVGLSALLLSIGLIFTLTEKKLLSSQEARDIADLAVHNLDAQPQPSGTAGSEEIQSARKILEAIRAQL